MLHKSKNSKDWRHFDVIAAKLKAHSEADSGEACNENKAACRKMTSRPPAPCKEIKEEQTCQNNNNEQTNNANNEACHKTAATNRGIPQFQGVCQFCGKGSRYCMQSCDILSCLEVY